MHPVSDSLEEIERDYVLVNALWTSIECISYFRDTSPQSESKTGSSVDTAKQIEQPKPTDMASSSTNPIESSKSCRAGSFPTSSTSTMLREVQGLSILHPSTKLNLLYQYVKALEELSQQKVRYQSASTDMFMLRPFHS